MTDAAERLKAELLCLACEDRAELAHLLLHSLDGAPGARAAAAWDAEPARRAEEIKGGKAVGEPADKVLAALREQYGGKSQEERLAMTPPEVQRVVREAEEIFALRLRAQLSGLTVETLR